MGTLASASKSTHIWIFSNIAYGFRPGQPNRFLWGDEQNSDEIDPLVGLSPKLLDIYAAVTWELQVIQPVSIQRKGLLERLTGVRQHMSHLMPLSGRKIQILADGASAYLHAAYVYALCRYHRKVLPTILD